MTRILLEKKVPYPNAHVSRRARPRHMPMQTGAPCLSHTAWNVAFSESESGRLRRGVLTVIGYVPYTCTGADARRCQNCEISGPSDSASDSTSGDTFSEESGRSRHFVALAVHVQDPSRRAACEGPYSPSRRRAAGPGISSRWQGTCTDPSRRAACKGPFSPSRRRKAGG